MSFIKRRLTGLNQSEFESYTPDPTSPIDQAYYGYECAIREYRVSDPDELFTMVQRYSKEIKDYYKDPDNWYPPFKAGEVLGCSNKTARKWFLDGFIRGEVQDGTLYQKIKLCKYDVLSLKEQLDEKGYKR